MMKKYLELTFLTLVILSLVACNSSEQKDPPYVIMISFDGFRHDYVEKFDAPNFKEFISQGAAAESMTPAFPSKTFPNHYSLVTGLYPGNHGLVDNTFYDRDLDLMYTIRNRERVENPAFYGGLPLWQLTQQNDMKSASFFWVGSETAIAGSYPDYYHIYDGNISNESRVSAVLDWLKLPDEDRPNFISLYFSLVDSQGHSTGPDSPETGETVLEADRLLGLLMAGLKAIDLPVNVIVTSDHGMNAVPETEETLLNTSEILRELDPDQYVLANNGAHAHLYVKDAANIDGLYQTLKERENHFKVYKKEEMPERWHYQHKRVGDIFIDVTPGYYMTSARGKRFALRRGATQGQHGFDPAATKDMSTIFYAHGPNIKEGKTIAPFENVHIYPLVAHILGITNLPEIDGDLTVLKPIYQK